MTQFFLTLCAGLLAAAQQVAGAVQCPPLLPSTSQPHAAPGVDYKILLNGISKPRGITVDSEGNLLVVEGGGRGIRRVVLNDAKGLDVCVDSSSQLVNESSLNHGIAISQDGRTIFASSSTTVFAWPYNATTGTVGKAKKVIVGMDQGGHNTRTLLIPRHNPDLLIVSRGSDGNVDEGTVDIKSGRSQIRIFEIPYLLDRGDAVEYSAGEVLGWGLRNSVGVADDPTNGNIWSVENSLDNMKRHGVDIHNNNPGEELNFHGRPNETTSDVYGRNFGYPGCVAIFDPSTVENYPESAKTGLQMAGDHLAGYSDKYCRDEVSAASLTFASHLAPLDIKFLNDGSAALVSFHGSWNRQPPNGYRLSRVTYANGHPIASPQARDAEEELLWNSDNADCPRHCFRPVGLALDNKSRLYMTSDSSGELFVLSGFEAAGVKRTLFKPFEQTILQL